VFRRLCRPVCNEKAQGVSSAVDRVYLSILETSMAKQKKTYKVGRDAGTGRFITVKSAERRKKTAVVETIKR